jgi:hypothetical protein
MTYGLDQCRVCGKPITPADPDSVENFEKSLHGRQTMSEREWRAAGYKAAPSRLQMRRRIDGCCFDCQITQGLSIINHAKLKLPIIGLIAALVILIFVVTLFN